MKITPKSIKEDLARSKSAYLKNDDLRCVATLASAIKAFLSVNLPGTDRMAIESQFREAFANLSKIPRVQRLAPKGVPYLKGQEDKLFKFVAALYRKVQEELEHESLAEMRERKLKIDQCILKGQKLLDDGNLLEAQRNFREAVSLRVDEDGLFPMLAMKLMDKGHYKASIEYLRGAIDTSPENARAYDLLVTAVTKSGEVEAGFKALADTRKKSPNNPLLLCASAQINAKAGLWNEAKAEADAALAAKPDLTAAAKVSAMAAKKL